MRIESPEQALEAISTTQESFLVIVIDGLGFRVSLSLPLERLRFTLFPVTFQVAGYDHAI